MIHCTLSDYFDLFFPCYFCRSPWLYPDFIFYKTKQGQKFKADCDFFHQVADDITDRRRKKIVISTLEKYYSIIEIIC